MEFLLLQNCSKHRKFSPWNSLIKMVMLWTSYLLQKESLYFPILNAKCKKSINTCLYANTS